MCGIAGYIGNSNLPKTRIIKCLELMQRRGPDASKYVEINTKKNNKLFLLHTRLNIIDLDHRSDQPFKVRNNFLSYNGELYNYKEIKKKLINKNFQFHTTSDTEVLANLLTYKGIDEIKNCEGMWAFSFYNHDEDILYLCRDRFGEKPLFYYKNETGLYFGSEPKFIFTLLGQSLSINYNHIYRYLVNGYKSLYKVKETFFNGLKQLDRASYLSFKNNEIKIKSYWKPNFNSENNNISYYEALEMLKDKLINSIKIRLRSDVPIAFCLSGGIDSNAIISIAKKVFNYDVHGFTIINTDKRYDEKEFVDAAVADLKLKHTPIPINKSNFLKNLRTVVKYHDSPISTINYYSHWQLMSEVSKKGYKVCVSGTAADEIYSGYYDHHIFFLKHLRNLKSKMFSKSKLKWEKIIKPFVRNQYLKDPYYLIENNKFRDHIFLDNKKFSKFLNFNWYEKFKEEDYCNIELRNRMLNEIFHETVPVILHEDDLNSMYFSIENRSPFLDKNLFEASISIPSEYLIKNGLAKSLLRDSVKDFAPKKIIYNPRKVGFNAPIDDYIDLSNRKTREEILDDSPIYDIIKKDKIDRIFKLDDVRNSESKFLFNFINAKFFLEEFL